MKKISFFKFIRLLAFVACLISSYHDLAMASDVKDKASFYVITGDRNKDLFASILSKLMQLSLFVYDNRLTSNPHAMELVSRYLNNIREEINIFRTKEPNGIYTELGLRFFELLIYNFIKMRGYFKIDTSSQKIALDHKLIRGITRIIYQDIVKQELTAEQRERCVNAWNNMLRIISKIITPECENW